MSDKTSMPPAGDHGCCGDGAPAPAANTLSRRLLLGGLGASAGLAAASTEAAADTAGDPYADPANPALPQIDMTLDLGRTALVIIDPQVDFLSPQGKAWGVFGESITEHNTVGTNRLDALGDAQRYPRGVL